MPFTLFSFLLLSNWCNQHLNIMLFLQLRQNLSGQNRRWKADFGYEITVLGGLYYCCGWVEAAGDIQIWLILLTGMVSHFVMSAALLLPATVEELQQTITAWQWYHWSQGLLINNAVIHTNHILYWRIELSTVEGGCSCVLPSQPPSYLTGIQYLSTTVSIQITRDKKCPLV